MSSDEIFKPELVFGLIVLEQVGYQRSGIRLSRLMHELIGASFTTLSADGELEQVLKSHMDAGNALRLATKFPDAVARLAVLAIRANRENIHGDATKPAGERAYILRSLKRPEEVKTLRRIYGSSFFAIAAYAPRPARVQQLAEQIAHSHHSNQAAKYSSVAEELVTRDENEIGDPYGQNVQDTFALADVVVNAENSRSMVEAIRRFVELLFGNSFHTPTRDEQGMFFAHGAALRSASLARQVGAAICRPDGSVVSVGANEVARPGGGMYWPGDLPDGRDFQRGYDSSDRMKINVIGEIFERLREADLLKGSKERPIQELVQECLQKGDRPVLKGVQLLGTIDYVRAVHAEMAALTDASRHGVATKGCVLYTTTFPCHDCAKHIVATGLTKVVYIEPYPKSLVGDLYADSVSVDAVAECGDRTEFLPFVGVAPIRYTDLFSVGGRRRKDSDGRVIAWSAAKASAIVPQDVARQAASVFAEFAELGVFKERLRECKLMSSSESP